MLPIRKDFQCEVKTEAKEGGGTRFRAVASTGSQDRQGEYLDPTGARMVNGAPLLYGHEYGKLRSNLGVCHSMKVEGNQVIVEGEFDDDIPTHIDAQIAAGKAKKGSLQYLSVGFNPLSVRSPDGKVRRLKPGEWAWPEIGQGYPEWEMVELSFVPVPANGEAELLVARALEEPGTKDRQAGLITALESVLSSPQFLKRLKAALTEAAPEAGGAGLGAGSHVPESAAPAAAEGEPPALEATDEIEALLSAEPAPDEIDELFHEAAPTGAGTGAAS